MRPEPDLMNRATPHWHILLGGGFGLLLIGGGIFLSASAGLLLAAAGGCLVGIGLTAWLWRSAKPGLPGTSPDAGRLDSVTTALQEGVQELYSLIELSRLISASLDLDQLLTTTLETLAATTKKVEGYCLFLLEETTNRLVVRTAGGRGTESLRNLQLAPGEGLAGRVFQTLSSEAHGSQDPFRWPDVPAEVRSVLAVPLVSQDKGVGVLTFFSPIPSAFSERDVAFFTAVANQLTVAVVNARLYHETRELSYRDGLTGLFNRRYFEETLDQELYRAERYRMPLSLIMADIDHFKPYNDTHGHPKGDQALKVMAAILTETTRRVDVVARYGGEEMVLILPLTPKHPALLAAEKLRLAVEGTQFPDGQLTMSLGVATYPEDGGSAAELIKAADDALYAAKQAGRNRVEVFSKPN
jgi:diguanylate cyclase (GGDEF)-like protein